MHFKARQWLSKTALFARDHQLWEKDSSLVVALSGGPDSTALSYLARYLVDENLCAHVRLIHINHGHRPNLEAEELVVTELAKKLGLELDIYRLEGLESGANFELRAREMRRQLLARETSPDELLLSAHHLDDSFEWWLAQSCKSSSSGVMGIPLVNGQWRRPFLCVTKAQIFTFLKLVGAKFINDPTANDEAMERNYLRKYITAKLDERYPKRLRHYAHRMNAEALERGVHLWSCREEELGLTLEQDELGGVLMTAKTWERWTWPLISYQLKRAVEQLSEETRGELLVEVQKTVAAVARHKKGPMSLSGGVLAYLFPQAIYLVPKVALQNYHDFESSYAQCLKEGSEIPEGLSHLCLVTPYFLKGTQTGSTFKTSLFAKLWENWPSGAKSLIYAYQAQRMFLDSCDRDR